MKLNFQNLNKTESYKTLASLKKQTSLDVEECLKQVVNQRYYSFFYGTSFINDTILNKLQDLADEQELISKYEAILNGEIMNPSEKRMVLHHLCRNTADSFYKTEQERSKTLANQIKKGKLRSSTGQQFDTVVQIGIGGSLLGPEAIFNALSQYEKPKLKTYFIGNIDPHESNKVLSKINLETTLFIIVSKSGTTLETSQNYEIIKKALASSGRNDNQIKQHIIAVTGKGSAYDNEDYFFERLYIDDHIGGRFSVTSVVGTTLLYLNFDHTTVNNFLTGAHITDKEALNYDVRNNAPLLAALIGVWERNICNYNAKAIIPYNSALSRFVAHLQQTDCESNGKSVSRQGKPLRYKTGPIIFGEPGTNAQHAFFQLLHQGTDIIPVQFIAIKDSSLDSSLEKEAQVQLNQNCIAQMVALAEGKTDNSPNKTFQGNRPSTLIQLDSLNPFSLGALLSFYENLITFQGLIWNINSFDQEGVQLGKVLAKSLNSEGDSTVHKIYNLFYRS